ncbi:MAG: thioredoxin family protein, partial [bacterium]
MYRRNIIKTAVAGISVSALAESMVFADPEGLKPLAIGSKAPDFDLPGVDDKRYRLADFNSAEVLVVIFTCNHCPTAQAYEERMMQFVEKYRSRGVAVVAISPNDDKALRLDELGFTDVSDSLADMKVRAADRKFNFPYLYDGESQKVALAYGCLATPHVFVFDKNRQLQYQGRFDDAEV